MAKIIQTTDNINKRDVFISDDVKCPFNDGDLIKLKNNIYLVNRSTEGYFCVHINSCISMKKVIPDDWTIYKKI